MLAGVREILIITTPHDQPQFIELLGDGSDLGVSFLYETQSEPKGLAQAFTIGKDFLAGESCLMVLGDNIFHGVGLGRDIIRELPNSGAHIFTYTVSNPSDYGILEVNPEGKPISIIEKPTEHRSNLAVTGMYFFDGDVSSIANAVKPSKRGELEITSVIEHYLNSGSLTFTHLSRGAAWLDTGNPDSLHDAASYVKIIEERTGLKVACLEEIAYLNNWIDRDQIKEIISRNSKNSYYSYLEKIINY